MTTTETRERAHVNAWIDTRHRDRLAALAHENDRSVSAELRRAVAAHVEREGVSSGEAAGVGNDARRTVL